MTLRLHFNNSTFAWMWFSVAKFKYSVFKNLLQNSNIPTCFQMWCWLSAFCWRSCQCWVAIMEVGQDLYTKCSTLHISRKCKPALFFSKQKKTFAFIFGQVLYEKCSNLHIWRKCKLAHSSPDFFLPGFACTPNGLCYTSYIIEHVWWFACNEIGFLRPNYI